VATPRGQSPRSRRTVRVKGTPEMTIKIAMHGATGRMGRTVIQLVHEAKDLTLAAALDGPSSAWLGRDAGDLASVGALGVPVTADLERLSDADVIVDFSLPVAMDALLSAVERVRRPLVLATTGL